jgi:hypothetical protein
MKHYLILITTLISLSVSAQNEESSTEYNGHQIGIHAGSTTGIGLSYRYWGKTFGVQTTFLPTANKSSTYINSAITLLVKLKDFEKVRLFGYLGNNYIYEKRPRYQSIGWGNYYPYTSINHTYNLGLGFGLDITLAKRLGLNLMFGYGGYDLINYPSLTIAGEGGLYIKL